MALRPVPGYDAVPIVTDHDAVFNVAAAARLVVGARNALGRVGFVAGHVVKG